MVEEAVVGFLPFLIKHTITNNNTPTITYLKVHVPSCVSWWASYGMVASFLVVLVVCCKVEVVGPSCEEAFPLVAAGTLEVAAEVVAD